MRVSQLLVLTVVLGSLASCGDGEVPAGAAETSGSETDPLSPTSPGDARPAVTQVSDERLIGADAEHANWLTHGRTLSEQRFSPLKAVDTNNVEQLGLAWSFDVPTARGMEATPIVVDGRMYVTGSWSIVYALDAATGDELWRFDPQVPKSWAQYACCDVVNRGVAVWSDMVYVGSLDGYLIAIDAATGTERWRVDTIDRKPPYTITGAPRVVKGMIIIGNGGADFGVRGYVSAYDAQSGELRWRFHTVPGDPDGGFENAAMEMAAETWTGQWWQYGGGGTVWDSIAFDPELDLLYFGVGNGSPWNRQIRSPEGGDNLFLSSIVAVRPDNGEYVWHYQTTPGESWDYTATQHMILADLTIEGVDRQVLMQAPKNGFFYVLDRTNGELISAEAFVPVTWATGIDPSGRPIEAPGARYEEEAFFGLPSGLGAHNWHPMAFDPTRSLVFLPAQQIPALYAADDGFEFTEGFWNTGINLETMHVPDDPAVKAELFGMLRGSLMAWDPVAQKELWRYQHAGPWNGGVLATAGSLVFQGSLIGEFSAFHAASGERLWTFNAQTGVAAAPVSYLTRGQQHVAVAAGWGTILSLLGGEPAAALRMKNRSRILAFRLGGTATLPELPSPEPPAIPEPPPSDASDEIIAAGKHIYYDRCVVCHGMNVTSGGVLPDLRHIAPEVHTAWDAIVLAGSLRDQGMPAFGGILSVEDSEAVHAFVLDESQRAWDRQQDAGAGDP